MQIDIDDLVITKYSRTETISLLDNQVTYRRIVVRGTFSYKNKLFVNEIFSNDNYTNNLFRITDFVGGKYCFESVSFKEGIDFGNVIIQERAITSEDYIPDNIPLKNGTVYIPTNKIKFKK